MKSKISLNNVNFTTPNGREIFRQLSFDFETGIIGLIGRNGVGKSTLLKLVVGEIEPDSGQISKEALFAYVPQIFEWIPTNEIVKKKKTKLLKN